MKMGNLNWNRILFNTALCIFSIFMGYLLFAPLFVIAINRSEIYSDLAVIPEKPIAMVLGAEVRPDGEPSRILYDRIKTGAELYKAGKVDKILVTGDNRALHYNESEAMGITLVEDFNVPIEDILIDEAGFRTYDSCYRAKNIFNADKIIAVSQGYHLYRTIFLCENLGIDTSGANATLNMYLGMPGYKVREFFAIHKAILDVIIKAPPYTAE